MGFPSIYSRFTLYFKDQEDRKEGTTPPPVELVISWLKEEYNQRRTWFSQMKLMLNSIEPGIVEKYFSEILGKL